MALTALVCLAFTLLAVWDRRRLVNGGQQRAGAGQRDGKLHGPGVGLGALSMLVTYQLRSQLARVVAVRAGRLGVAALCLFFASMMAKDAAAGRQDDAMLNIARYLTIGQLAGMVIAMVGMIIDDKMPRDPSEPDWAANAIFFFGAAALAVISANALWGPRRGEHERAVSSDDGNLNALRRMLPAMLSPSR